MGPGTDATQMQGSTGERRKQVGQLPLYVGALRIADDIVEDGHLCTEPRVAVQVET